MLVRNWKFITICFVFMLVTVLGCSVCAQEQTSADLWKLAPSNSLLVVGFDGRPENPSMQALAKVEDAEAKDLRIKQQADLRKAVEDFATLFGISLDFAKDIDSWADMQWAFVMLPEGVNKVQPVFMMASKDSAAANAAMQKMLAPWQRVGELIPEPDTDFAITSFKEKNCGVEVYASAFGQVIAFSPSKECLKLALNGTGFPVDSSGDKVFKALSGSMSYMFIDPILLKKMNIQGFDIPMNGLGVGISAVETGVRVHVIGYPNEQTAAMLSGMLSSQQKDVLIVNPGIQSTSLVAASMPNLAPLTSMMSLGGMSDSPIADALKSIGDMQISAAVTAVLPAPAIVISAMASSDEAATEKMAVLTQIQKPFKPAIKINGIDAIEFGQSNGKPLYLAKVGKYIYLATDTQSLSGAVAAAKGEIPSITQLATYNEVMAGLSNSNLLTMYTNLAPVQGVGFLIDGMGFGQVQPFYSLVAKGLQNLQAMGIGLGYDGEAVNVEMFVRAKPGVYVAAGPIFMSTATLGAVLFPVFENAREKARQAACLSNLKQLSLGAIMYSQDYNGKLPARDNWQYQINPNLRQLDIMECPAGKATYAFNKNLGGLNLNKIKNPSEVILFFEASPDLPYASGSRADAMLPHNGFGNFAYADGHVKALSQVPDQSHWVPKYETPKPVNKIYLKKSTTKKPSVKTTHHR